MKEQNSCYTYFTIVGEFQPQRVTALLGLQPTEAWNIGDMRGDGTRHEFARWNFGRCEAYDGMVDRQMTETITPLLITSVPPEVRKWISERSKQNTRS